MVGRVEWWGVLPDRPGALISLWERACSRLRSASQNLHGLSHRYRGQARSHSARAKIRIDTQSYDD
ncbi:hypothetical protein EGM97_12400 [Pseudomonas sp. AF32]|nr:hypothetical protein [Pseudomonas sp. AF32]